MWYQSHDANGRPNALTSGDGLWLDQSEDQRRVSFDYWFDRGRPLIEEASFVLMKDRRIVGFFVARSSGEESNLGPFGIHPDFRSQGLAKALLARSMRAIEEKGFKIIELEADTENQSAIGLYKGAGFKLLHRKINYSWKES